MGESSVRPREGSPKRVAGEGVVSVQEGQAYPSVAMLPFPPSNCYCHGRSRYCQTPSRPSAIQKRPSRVGLPSLVLRQLPHLHALVTMPSIKTALIVLIPVIGLSIQVLQPKLQLMGIGAGEVTGLNNEGCVEIPGECRGEQSGVARLHTDVA